MDIDKIKNELTNAGIDTEHLDDRELETAIKNIKNSLGDVREAFLKLSKAIRGICVRYASWELKELEEKSRHIKRVKNRQKLYEKRKRQGRL